MTSPAASTLDIPSRVQHAVSAAQDVKAIDLKVLHLEKVTDFTDYFLVMSGATGRQVQAIADAVLGRLRDRRVRPLHSEGVHQGKWVLLDYGDFVVHIFDHERRELYGLERLWGDAPDVTASFAGSDAAAGNGQAAAAEEA